MKRDFEKAKDAIWAKWERKLGFPLDVAYRARIEQVVVEVDEDDEALSDLDKYLEDYFDQFRLLSYFAGRKPAKASPSGKTYQRCFEKRFRIVDFVMDRRPHRERGKMFLEWIEYRRIDWKLLSAEWNEANPYDPMSPAVLKVRFYRAIADKAISLEYYKKRYRASEDAIGTSQWEATARLSRADWQFRHFFPSAFEEVRALTRSHQKSYMPKRLAEDMEAWRNMNPATSKWQQIEVAGDIKALDAVYRIWFADGSLTTEEKDLLAGLHQKYPLDQPDFDTWLGQTLRQLFEESVSENPMLKEAHHERQHHQAV